MRNRQEWFNEKMAAVSPEIVSEVQLSADIIARLDAILQQKNMTQKDLARKMGRSEAAISRWTSGFPNLTLKSIAEISTALAYFFASNALLTIRGGGYNHLVINNISVFYRGLRKERRGFLHACMNNNSNKSYNYLNSLKLFQQ
ncbi:MAG: helix-turn-helix transcriptional regulator [Bacteroidales bacterium]|nr:helix-turn-helix transcriptional regulator [Bacteroidales bacterium]